MPYMLTSLAVALGAAAQAASGFGFALLPVPLLALVLGAKTAVVTTAVVAVALRLGMFSVDRRDVVHGRPPTWRPRPGGSGHRYVREIALLALASLAAALVGR